MKTGKLFKFHRPGGEIHAYVYRDGGLVRAALYVMSPGGRRGREPTHLISGMNEGMVESAVRAWLDEHYPR